jgi:hypothetical protein
MNLYTVRQCRKDDTLYGPTHGSQDANTTACGKEIDSNWYIITNGFDGKITCKDCIKLLKNQES